MRLLYTLAASTGIALAIALLPACTGLRDATDREHMFRGAATFAKLPPALRASPLVTYCAPSMPESLDFTARTFPATAVTGEIGYRLAERVRGITGFNYSATRQAARDLPGIEAWPDSRGRVVSCGGLVDLAFSESRARDEEANGCAGAPNRRYVMTGYDDMRGELFPMRVGNELAFTYDALLRTWTATDGCVDSRITTRAEFAVLGHNDAFRVAGRPVPGRVYLVERTLTALETGERVKRDYYYSAALGWVVMSVEYRNGLPVNVVEMMER